MLVNKKCIIADVRSNNASAGPGSGNSGSDNENPNNGSVAVSQEYSPQKVLNSSENLPLGYQHISHEAYPGL